MTRVLRKWEKEGKNDDAKYTPEATLHNMVLLVGEHGICFICIRGADVALDCSPVVLLLLFAFRVCRATSIREV